MGEREWGGGGEGQSLCGQTNGRFDLQKSGKT